MEYSFSCRSFWKNEKRIFSCHSFSLPKLFTTVYNFLFLVMSSSFCRRPNSHILAYNHTFIVIFYKAFYAIFSITISCCDPGKFQICIYALLNTIFANVRPFHICKAVVRQNDKFWFLYLPILNAIFYYSTNIKHIISNKIYLPREMVHRITVSSPAR